jgi:hypothetical protein
MATTTPVRNYGTSPYVKITSESMRLNLYQNVAKLGALVVKPPSLNIGGAVSAAMGAWVQPWPLWNYSKLTEPKFDGICNYIGTISNKPDMISNYHFIGLMRNVDVAIAPQYQADITASSSGNPRFSNPNVPRTGGVR